MNVIRCGIHGFHETLGIDAHELHFYWQLSGGVEGDEQTAYQVVVATSPSALVASSDTAAVVWDSGKIQSNQQRNVVCKPADGFRAITSHYWQVNVWDAHGGQTSSDVNTFFTAYPRSSLLPPWSMNQTYMPHSSLIFRTWFENEDDRWKAVWIGDGGDKPIYLRKSFDISKKPTKAIAFASGLGHFNLSCNSAPASNHVLDPGWTNPHRTVQYVGYDLTEHLQQGSNAIGAHVGNGFYAGDQGDRFFWPMYEDNTYVRYGNELCFFLELHLFYDDGSREVVHTDPSWKVSKSATSLANIYASETHDRRLYPHGWDSTTFDDASWASAKPLTGPRGLLKYQSQPPVTRQDEFKPVSTKTPQSGTICYDLGQNSSIMVKLAFEGKAGSEIIVRYSETVREDGTVLMPDPLFKEFETNVYSKIYLAGTGEETWEPDFCFTSARYIQIEGVAQEAGQGLPIVKSVIGQHVSSAARRLGSIKTDKEDVNQLINACYWSFVSNLFSYHTDCPQIEKFGWQEVTHLLAPATQYMRDVESLYTKILDDIIDTQEPSGLCPTMAPEIRYMCGPLHDTITWGCSVCFLPELLKRYYGSTHVIPKVYPAARRYMDYMQKKERKGGLIEHGLGDWGIGIAFGNHQANIETAIYYRCLKNTEMMANELGRKSEAAEYAKRAEQIQTAYNKHLLVTDDAEVPFAYYTSLDNYPARDRTAIAQAMALQFDLVPAEHVADVQKAFLAAVADCRIRAGEIGLKYLWNTLGDLKRPDIVLAMARQEEHPSYMRFLRRGETTLLEFWQDACRSKCHDMLGTIYEWFYDSVLGLRTLGEAYRTFEVRPAYEAEFGLVEGSVECPYGKIAIRNEKKDGCMVTDLEVPMGTVATFMLPGKESKGEYSRAGAEKKSLTGPSVELEHGQYHLTVYCS